MKSTIAWSLAILACLLGMPSGSALSSDSPRADPPPATQPAAAEAKKFQSPPGFVRKTRGKLVLYCKRDNALGTRIRTESCYSESQVREYLLAVKQQQEDVNRIRNNCGNVCVCGSPEICNPNIRRQ